MPNICHSHRVVNARISRNRTNQELPLKDLSDRITELLNPIHLIGDKLERIRVAHGYTLDDLLRAANQVLEPCQVAMPSQRSAITKIEHGRRGVDFVEGMAIAISLGISPWDLVPKALADKRSMQTTAWRMWALKTHRELDELHHYEFEHLCHGQPLTFVIGDRLQLPPAPLKDSKILLSDVITLNQWSQSLTHALRCHYSKAPA
jgi:transcriptional regulator with XRE-family HTH domain